MVPQSTTNLSLKYAPAMVMTGTTGFGKNYEKTNQYHTRFELKFEKKNTGFSLEFELQMARCTTLDVFLRKTGSRWCHFLWKKQPMKFYLTRRTKFHPTLCTLHFHNQYEQETFWRIFKLSWRFHAKDCWAVISEQLTK